MRITDPDKIIPSYIHRRDEGELWSLNFEGRVFCCWKCGSGSHIGDKCRDQTRTFEVIFGGVDSVGGECEKPTWAAVVRSGKAESDAQTSRVKEMERKVREENLRKDQENRDLENVQQRDEAEAELQRKEHLLVRQKALDEVKAKARLLKEQDGGVQDQCAASLSVVAVTDRAVNLDPVVEFRDRALLPAIKHKSWLDARTAGGFSGASINVTLDPRLELFFSTGDQAGNSRLAIEYHGTDGLGGHGAPKSDESLEDSIFDDDDDDISDIIVNQNLSSTPKRQRERRTKLNSGGGPTTEKGQESDMEEEVVMDLMALGSSFITDDSDSSYNSESDSKENKKLKMDDMELGQGISAGNGVQELSEVDGYMTAGKEGVSTQVVNMSSEVTGDASLSGSTEVGKPGEE